MAANNPTEMSFPVQTVASIFVRRLAKKPNKQKKSRVFLRPGGRPTLDGGGGGQWSNIRGETKKLRRQEEHHCHWPAARLLLGRVAKTQKNSDLSQSRANLYRTQVYLDSDLWVHTPLCYVKVVHT